MVDGRRALLSDVCSLSDPMFVIITLKEAKNLTILNHKYKYRIWKAIEDPGLWMKEHNSLLLETSCSRNHHTVADVANITSLLELTCGSCLETTVDRRTLLQTKLCCWSSQGKTSNKNYCLFIRTNKIYSINYWRQNELYGFRSIDDLLPVAGFVLL